MRPTALIVSALLSFCLGLAGCGKQGPEQLEGGGITKRTSVGVFYKDPFGFTIRFDSAADITASQKEKSGKGGTLKTRRVKALHQGGLAVEFSAQLGSKPWPEDMATKVSSLMQKDVAGKGFEITSKGKCTLGKLEGEGYRANIGGGRGRACIVVRGELMVVMTGSWGDTPEPEEIKKPFATFGFNKPDKK